MSIALRSCLAFLLALAPLACSDDGGPTDPGGDGPLDVSGTYASTFTGAAENCGGLVPDGSASGDLVVTQTGNAVTLEITDLNPSIRSNPTGTIDENGNFTFQGPITVGDGTSEIDAQGTITGIFSRSGQVDLDFAFSAFTCVVEGTIVGSR